MKPVKIFKITGIVIAAIIVFLVISAGLFIYFFPKDKVRTIVIEQAQTILQRRITLESLYYSPRGVILRNVAIHEGKETDSPVMISAEWVSLGFALKPLLHKEIDVKHLIFYHLDATVTFDRDGKSNLEKMIRTVLDSPGQSVNAKIASVKLFNSFITIVKPPAILKPLEGRYCIDVTVKLPEPQMIQLSNCTLVLPEKRGKLNPDIMISFDKNFKIQGNVDLDKVSLAWVYQWHGTQYPQPYDIVTGKVHDLLVTPEKIEGFVKASSTLHNSTKIVFADGFCRVEPPKRTVLISGTQAKINSTTALLNKLFLTMDGDVLAIDATNASASITDLKELIPVIPDKLYGWVTGNLSYNGKISCSLHLKEVGYEPSTKMISGINTNLSVDKNIFKVEKLQLKIFGHDCLVSVASTDGDFKRLILNLNSEKLNLQRIQSGSGGREKSLNIPLEIAGSISARKLETPDLTLDNLNINYQIKGKNVLINQFSCQYLGSDLRGRGAIDLSTNPPRASGLITFANLKIQNLGIVSEKFKNRLFGIASGNLNLTMDLASHMFETIRGTVDFSIDNGKVVDTGIQHGLGIWLSELRFKLKDLEFNKVYGNARIMGKLFQINSFIFKSENIRLKMEGSLSKNLDSNGLNLSLEFKDYFIQDIPRPAVMSLKKYQTGQWYIIPFSVKGDITDSKNIHQVK